MSSLFGQLFLIKSLLVFCTKHFLSLGSLLFLDLFEIENPQGGYLMDSIKSIIEHLGYDIVGEDEPLQLFTIGQFVEFRKLRNLVIHQEKILEVGKRIRHVAHLLDSVIRQDHCRKLVQKREVVQLPDLVIAEVDAFEEVQRGTHVFNLGQLVPPEVELSLIKRVGELVRVLDQLCGDFHSIIKGLDYVY